MNQKICILLLCALLFAAPSPSFTEDGGDAQSIWKDYIYRLNTTSVLDQAEVLQMLLFSAQNNTGIRPWAAALGSAMYRAGHPEVLKGPLSEALLLRRARELKQTGLTAEEVADVTKLQQEIALEYARARPQRKPGAIRMDITFGLGEVRNLQRTIQDCPSLPAALAEIERLHGFACTPYSSASAPFAALKEAIDRGLPAILQAEERLFLCFGYLHVEGKPYLVLSEPANTPLAKEYFKGSKSAQESLDPRVVATLKAYKGATNKIATDYEITTQKQIPEKGFSIEPFEREKYQTFILLNWRRSARAWDEELRKLLKLPEPRAEDEAEIELPGAGAGDRELWEHYILGREETIDGPYVLVPSVIIPAGRHWTRQYACLASSSCTRQGAVVGAFSLSLRKLYRGACDLLDEPYLMLKGDQRKSLEDLLASLREQYATKQKSIESAAETADDPYMEAALRLKETITPSANLHVALQEIERLHGWQATVETSADVPLDDYREALHKGIPVLLQENVDGKWLLCIGCLRHRDTDLLIVVDPGLLDAYRSVRIDNQQLYPGGWLTFEPFAAGQYTPWFIHDWHISVDAHQDKIAAIFDAGEE